MSSGDMEDGVRVCVCANGSREWNESRQRNLTVATQLRRRSTHIRTRSCWATATADGGYSWVRETRLLSSPPP